MSTNDPIDDDAAPVIAATFIDRESADAALAELHRAGFRKVWLGVTRSGTLYGDEPTIESENAGGFMESLGRFFSGEVSRGHALHEALVTHGLSETQAHRIDAAISPGNAVVLVDGDYDPSQAMRILEEYGGELESNGARGLGSREAALVDDNATVRGARDIDEDRQGDAKRLELREERLAIDKERVRSGEARVGKNVVSQEQSLDVPVFREELYIERRPGRGTRSGASATPIGEGEEIRVPLTAERVEVSKHTVVTEEVAVGKRRIDGTQHVSETTRREELLIDDPTTETTRVRDDAPLRDR